MTSGYYLSKGFIRLDTSRIKKRSNKTDDYRQKTVYMVSQTFEELLPRMKIQCHPFLKPPMPFMNPIP